MSDDFKVQANLKLGNDLFNFRGLTVEEVEGQLTEFADRAEAIFDAYDRIRQVTLAKGLTSSQGLVPSAPSTPVTTHGGQAQGATNADLRCRHGAYKDLLGKTKKDGSPYQFRYYCPAPFGAKDACKAGDLPGQVRLA